MGCDAKLGLPTVLVFLNTKTELAVVPVLEATKSGKPSALRSLETKYCVGAFTANEGMTVLVKLILPTVL